MEHFYVIELKLSEYHELSWAYVNALQTRDVIIVPGIGNAKLDNEAMGQFIALYPDYKHHNTENDNRYKSIIEKYQNDSNSVCFDEIQFLGDYYPRKIENVSKELDRLYYGF